MSTSPRGRREAKRLEIMRGASSTFRRLGYHATNMTQIAQAAGMTKSNLYNYFKDKEDLLFFCHECGVNRLLQILNKVERSPYPPEVKLRRLIAGFVHWIVDGLDGGTLTLELKQLTGPRLRKIIVKRDQLDRGMRHIIREGVSAGAFRPVDPKLYSFAIWGSLNWIPRWFDPGGPAESVEISDVLVDCFFNGLLGQSSKKIKTKSKSSHKKRAVARREKPLATNTRSEALLPKVAVA